MAQLRESSTGERPSMHQMIRHIAESMKQARAKDPVTHASTASWSRRGLESRLMERNHDRWGFDEGKIISCPLCENGHALRKCAVFLRLHVNACNVIAQSLNVCCSCLRMGHRLPSCPEQGRCGIAGCTRRHAPEMHDDSRDANLVSTDARGLMKLAGDFGQRRDDGSSRQNTNADRRRGREPLPR